MPQKTINKKNKSGLMAIHKAFTGINLISNNNYINLSNDINLRDVSAPVGLMVFQRSQKPCLHRRLGSIPSWSASLNSLFNIANLQENI